MRRPRLIFHPVNIADTVSDTSGLIQALKNIGFIDQSLDTPNAYLPGNDFLSLITFLGCSPHINLHPDDGDNFCAISISTICTQATNLGYTSTAKAKCPHCGAAIKNWKNIENWQLADTLFECEKCGKEARMHELKWREKSGYGHSSIAVMNIHPHEAVPADKLLNTLADATGFKWIYCYADNEETI